MLASLLPLLPLAAGLSILPNPGDMLALADSFLPHSESAADTLVVDNEMRLSSVGEEHITITSALHPKHKVRIKSTDGWCDPDVKSYSGYLDVGHGKDLWFSFFESRGDPANDPVIMWINGGPGCSSAMGMLMELGPCSVAGEPKSVNDTKVNPHAWNNHANVFFLDEPIGVGFSRARHGQVVGTAEAAGQDVAAFVSIFFDTFKEFRGRAFHMAGESYGGRYLPIFASAVYDNNKALVAAGKEPINLQSVMIGNGMTDFYSVMESYVPFQCTKHVDLNTTIQSIGNCVAMAESVPRCKNMLRKSCIESHDATECSIAVMFCETTIAGTFAAAGLNPYDVSKACTQEELDTTLCYPEMAKIKTYLNLPDTRALLGIEGKAAWEGCSESVGAAFMATLDPTGQTWLYVTELLERGVRVLNYVGTLDWICNYMGNEQWMEALQWSGKDAYNVAKLQKWKVDGKVAGEFKTAGLLTFLKVFGAGHMVPMDQPKHSDAFVRDWLKAGSVGK